MATKHIDEPRLADDLQYRYEYLAEFIGFGPEDISAIHAVADKLGPQVPALVEAVYVKLFQYDVTKQHFVKRQHGYQGAVPESLEALDLNHEMMHFRKQHLGDYLRRLVTDRFDATLVAYLDLVGKIHTPQAGSSQLIVPLLQMNALLGYLGDLLLETIHGWKLDPETEFRTIRAFSKLLWIQNDLINRHYLP